MSTRPAPDRICGRDEGGDLERCDMVVVDARRVRAVRERLVTAATAERMAAVFKVLADPSRCRLVAALIEAGELCVCDLAAAVSLSESSVSHHLRILRAHGLVRARRDGRRVFYRPDDTHIERLLEITREHVEHTRGGADTPDGLTGSNPARRRAPLARGRS